MRVLVLLTLVSFLTGCATAWEDKTAQNLCPAFNDWVDAGPREITGSRSLSLPDAYNPAASSFADDPDVIVITRFEWDYNCLEGITCEDANDIVFRDFLRQYAHSVSGFGYYSLLERCLGKRTSNIYDPDPIVDKIEKATVHDAEVVLRWNANKIATQVFIEYN